MAEIAALGLKNIRVAASSLFPVHAALVEYMRRDVVTGIVTSYMSGPAVAQGVLSSPVILQTHGGRARDRGGAKCTSMWLSWLPLRPTRMATSMGFKGKRRSAPTFSRRFGIGEVHDLSEGIGLCLCLTIRLSRT